MQKEKYDSRKDTERHIQLVRTLLYICVKNLEYRASVHDASKLKSPEKEFFDKYTPLLENTTYGSDEYKEHLKNLKPALDHHYANNSHHPEFYEDGINGMDLFDVMEMLMDWTAATKRHNDGDIMKSIDINEKRFEINPQLSQIFRNTINKMKLNEI